MKLATQEIIVGKRRREDYGDLQGLADSIAKVGLIHPIVIDAQHRLVAGGRRLRAITEILKWPEVEVRDYGELTDTELREIELEENLRRKDLSPYERSRNLAELVTVAADVLRGEAVQQQDVPGFHSTLNENPHGGRPAKPDAEDRIAERIGVSQPTINRAREHVAAAERYPELKAPGIPQQAAITIARNLDKLPEPVREEKREAMRRFDQDVTAELAEKPAMPKDIPSAQEREAKSPGAKWTKSLHDLYMTMNSVRDLGGVAALASRWEPTQQQNYLEEIRRVKGVLAAWESELSAIVEGRSDHE